MKNTDILTKYKTPALIGGGILLVLLIYLFVKKIISSKKTEETLSKASEDTNSSSGLAQSIHGALSDFNVDEGYIIQLGGKVCDLDELRKEYKTLYKTDLMTDLEKALNADELARFKSNVTLNKGNCSTDKKGKITPNPKVRTPEYCKAIAKELRTALGDGSFWFDADEAKLVDISARIYDYDQVISQYKILYNQNLKELIDSAFDIVSDPEEKKQKQQYLQNIEENRLR